MFHFYYILNILNHCFLFFQIFFPGVINVAYVLRPAGFFQKAISEVSNKLFKEEFRFRVEVCSCLEELHEFIDKSQLTSDLGGDLKYSHIEWIQQRIVRKIMKYMLTYLIYI